MSPTSSETPAGGNTLALATIRILADVLGSTVVTSVLCLLTLAVLV